MIWCYIILKQPSFDYESNCLLSNLILSYIFSEFANQAWQSDKLKYEALIRCLNSQVFTASVDTHE